MNEGRETPSAAACRLWVGGFCCDGHVARFGAGASAGCAERPGECSQCPDRAGRRAGDPSLPPGSPQTADYRYDPQLDTFTRSDALGPTAFVSLNTVGRGRWSVGFRASYQDLSRTESSSSTSAFGRRCPLRDEVRSISTHADGSRAVDVHGGDRLAGPQPGAADHGRRRKREDAVRHRLAHRHRRDRGARRCSCGGVR